VVLGAAMFSRGFGYFPVPMQALYRRLKEHTTVVVLDEPYTSQLCSKCAHGAIKLEGLESKTDKMVPGKCGKTHGRGKKSEIWAVKWCPHRNCLTRWNRDVNAARNMRQIFLTMLYNGQVRPPPFKHPKALSR